MYTQPNNLKNLRREPQVNAMPGAIPSVDSNSTAKIQIGKKIVGVIKDGNFIKRVHSSKHFLRKPPAIAFDIDTLTQAQDLGAIKVKIIDLDTNTIYIASIELIFEKGFVFNRGYGIQIGLTLNYWNTSSPTQPNLSKPTTVFKPQSTTTWRTK